MDEDGVDGQQALGKLVRLVVVLAGVGEPEWDLVHPLLEAL
ncbi:MULTISPECIES: hypothetical protein [unclassified Streptomyces]|nr:MULTISPECIES: hypothetical protein [unclassified Streptomyces]